MCCRFGNGGFCRRARDVVVRNSFVRCQDDAITPKYWCENLVCTNMTLWTDAANAFRTGYECESGESGLVYRNLLYKDIDVLHLSLNKNKPTEYVTGYGTVTTNGKASLRFSQE